MVDVDQSSLVRLFSRIFSPANSNKNPSTDLTLIDVPRGHRAKVIGFAKTIPNARKAHLQAYGVVPGHWVRVLQHSPVTVVQIEHTELAIERDLAERIQVDEMGVD
ncbi:MAG: ferrous iron transport protein A [Anaerolineales bacterium]|jgi:Fe2+ transport system protein FeoA